MRSRRRLVEVQVEPMDKLRRHIDALTPTQVRAVAAKDVHLVEAALQTDRTITALDARARAAFARIATSMTELDALACVNPHTDAGVKEWLRQGAPARDEYLLRRHTS